MVGMKTQEHERYSMIRLFEIYISALSRLVDQDSGLFLWRRNRMAVCHRLAHHLEQGLFGALPPEQQKEFSVDMCVPISGDSRTVVADILVHNRSAADPQRLMAVVCREGYLTEEELLSLHNLKTETGCELTLAVAFLPQKGYMLIYRADETRIDYYHFNRIGKHCQLLKRRQVSDLSGDGNQLKLGIKTARQPVPRP